VKPSDRSRSSTSTPSIGQRGRWVWPLLAAVALALAGTLHTGSGLLKALPPDFIGPARAAAVLLVGVSVSLLTDRWILTPRAEWLNPRQATTLRFLVRLGLYLAILLAVLAAFGVGLSSVVFGGAFFTVVIGLAGQTMLGNLLAGMWIVLFHPFELGDHVEVIAWQYPVLVSSYPHESQKPVHVGVITDINLMYTELTIEADTPMLIPNGVLVTAAVINRSRARLARTRVRFDVPARIPPTLVVDALRNRLQQGAGTVLARVEFVGIVDVSAETYAVLVVGAPPRPARRVRPHYVLNEAWAVLHAVPSVQPTASDAGTAPDPVG
jgi:small conductance mechanosensitive channel